METRKAYLLGASVAALLLTHSPVSAQGVPVVDAAKNAREASITAQMEADLELQAKKAEQQRRQLEASEEQSEALNAVRESMTLPESGKSMIADLDDAENPADAVYSADDSPAADRLFGTGRENVERVIIRAARDTHHLQHAGLSPLQWRCWLQALIWQESRFNPYAESHVGAYGLTQIMPATAGDLGIRATYRTDPYVQAEGGARYLAQRLNEFDGDMILALAAYNAGAGNVRRYGGVPPFAETQKYVQLIPNKYREYMAAMGAADELGSIEPSLMANAEKAMIGGATAEYAQVTAQSMDRALVRLEDAMSRISSTTNSAEAMALNTYVRTEFARLLVVRTRLVSARVKPMTADQVAAASAYIQERNFMNFSGGL